MMKPSSVLSRQQRPSDHRPQECGPSVRAALPLFLGSQGVGPLPSAPCHLCRGQRPRRRGRLSPSISSNSLTPACRCFESLPWSVLTAWRRSPATPRGSGPCLDFYNRWKEKGRGRSSLPAAARHASWGCNCRIRVPSRLGSELPPRRAGRRGQTQRPATARRAAGFKLPIDGAVSCSTASPATCAPCLPPSIVSTTPPSVPSASLPSLFVKEILEL